MRRPVTKHNTPVQTSHSFYNGAAGSTRQAMAQALDVGNLSDQIINEDNAALQAGLIDPDGLKSPLGGTHRYKAQHFHNKSTTTNSPRAR